MPPEPFEYEGRAAIAAFLRQVRADARARGGREARLLPTRANGQPAFGHYLRDACAGEARGSGLLSIALDGRGAVTAITRFGDAALLGRFGLPPSVRC